MKTDLQKPHLKDFENRPKLHINSSAVLATPKSVKSAQALYKYEKDIIVVI